MIDTVHAGADDDRVAVDLGKVVCWRYDTTLRSLKIWLEGAPMVELSAAASGPIHAWLQSHTRTIEGIGTQSPRTMGWA